MSEEILSIIRNYQNQTYGEDGLFDSPEAKANILPSFAAGTLFKHLRYQPKEYASSDPRFK